MDVRKAEERLLSDQIYQHLQMLTVMYPSSNFQSFLALDMFIKPNTKAFPFVMHFLFNIHDAAEFKKRFYWPILDRNTENNFRTTTVQYLNYLNEKHSLGWGEVKSFLVVMPGGMKFMKFLMDLINFVVQEEIKKTEKSLPDSVVKSKSLCTEHDLKNVIEQHQIFISKAVEFKDAIDSKKVILKENTEKIKETLEDVCKAIEIDPNEIDQQFAQSFAESNQKLFEKSIVREVDNIEESEVLIDKLLRGIDKFNNDKGQFPCDKEALLASYKTIQNDFPEYCPNSIHSGNKISLKALFEAFNCIVPLIDRSMAQFELKGKDCYEFEENEINKIVDESNQLECDISKIEKNIDKIEIDVNDVDSVKSIGTPDRLSAYAESNLKLKYVQTPAIYVDPESHSSNACPRLPLLDENTDLSYASYANQTTVPKSSRDKNMSFVVPGYTKSKIIDPLTLLRSVTKTKRRQHFCDQNESIISNVQAEPYLSQTIIGTYTASTPSPIIVKKNCSVKTTESETIKRKHVNNAEIIMTPDISIYQQKNRTKSVHDAIQALDLNTMSKSPSGRLDSLATFDKQELPENFLNDTPLKSDCHKRDIPRILLNDTHMDFEKTKLHFEEDPKLSEFNKENCSGNKSDEDNLGSSCDRKKIINEVEESIFNISDSILKDITM